MTTHSDLDTIDWDRASSEDVNRLLSYVGIWSDQNRASVARQASYQSSLGNTLSIAIILFVSFVMLDAGAQFALCAVFVTLAARTGFLYVQHRTSIDDRRLFETEAQKAMLDMAARYPKAVVQRMVELC